MVWVFYFLMNLTWLIYTFEQNKKQREKYKRMDDKWRDEYIEIMDLYTQCDRDWDAICKKYQWICTEQDKKIRELKSMRETQ